MNIMSAIIPILGLTVNFIGLVVQLLSWLMIYRVWWTNDAHKRLRHTNPKQLRQPGGSWTEIYWNLRIWSYEKLAKAD